MARREEAGLDWTTGSRGLRARMTAGTRYDFPRTLDPSGLILATASPLAATMLLLISLAIRG